MQAIRFKTYIDDSKTIKVPDSVTLPNTTANVIVLIEVDQIHLNQEKKLTKNNILRELLPKPVQPFRPFHRGEIYER